MEYSSLVIDTRYAISSENIIERVGRHRMKVNEHLSFTDKTAEVFPQNSVQCFANKSIDVANVPCNSTILSLNCVRCLKNTRCNPLYKASQELNTFNWFSESHKDLKSEGGRSPAKM